MLIEFIAVDQVLPNNKSSPEANDTDERANWLTETNCSSVGKEQNTCQGQSQSEAESESGAEAEGAIVRLLRVYYFPLSLSLTRSLSLALSLAL